MVGSCEHDADATPLALPTAYFAIFFMHVVRFRCGQLFHLFDEQSFMQGFEDFHRGTNSMRSWPDLWCTHYTLLALGIVLNGTDYTGFQTLTAQLFAQGMKVVPYLAFSNTDSMESIEILCCAALY